MLFREGKKYFIHNPNIVIHNYLQSMMYLSGGLRNALVLRCQDFQKQGLEISLLSQWPAFQRSRASHRE